MDGNMQGGILQWLLINIVIIFIARLMFVTKETSYNDKNLFSMASSVYLALSYAGFFIHAIKSTDMTDMVLKYHGSALLFIVPYSIAGAVVGGTSKIAVIGSFMCILALAMSTMHILV